MLLLPSNALELEVLLSELEPQCLKLLGLASESNIQEDDVMDDGWVTSFNIYR